MYSPSQTEFVDKYMLPASIWLIILVWEHIGRIYCSLYRPSLVLKWISSSMIYIFTKLGSMVASISSFYNYFHISDLIATIYDLIHPFFKMIISPCYFFSGYISTAILSRHPLLVYMGSITIVIMIYFSLFWTYPLLVEKIQYHCIEYIFINHKGLLAIGSIIISVIMTIHVSRIYLE